MLNLASDISQNGLLGCQQPTVVYSDEIEKYIVYEGNRRIACMKLLLNPEKFDFLGKQVLSKIQKIITKGIKYDLSKIDCYVTDEKEAFFIMERIHSGEDQGRGTKRWSSREKDAFKVRKREDKTLTYLIDYYVRKTCNDFDITTIMPFTTVKRIFDNKRVKHKIGLDVLDESTFTKDRMEIVIYVASLVVQKSRDVGKAPTRLYNKAFEIEMDVLPWIEEYYNSKLIESKLDDFVMEEEKKATEKYQTENESENSDETIKSTFEKEKSVEESNIVKTDTSKEDNFNQHISAGGKRNIPYFFQGLKYDKLNPEDSISHGISNICREVQLFSNRKLVGDFPLAAAFLVRSIIEQSIIYYSKRHYIQGQHKLIFEDLKNFSKLSAIITKYNRNLANYISDPIVRQYFSSLFGNYDDTVNPLNWVVHRPSEYIIDDKMLINLPHQGLLTIINYFLNE